MVTYVRVIDGKLSHRDRIKMMSTGAVHEMLEVGVISPEPVKAGASGVGEVGYLITGVKDVRQSPGRRHRHHSAPRRHEALGGYKHPNPMVYSGLYPIDGDDYPTCATRSTSSSSTTPRWPTSRRPPGRSASASAAASSACCTWRSSASGSSASSTST